MKYYDKGFIYYYDDYINLQLFNIGKLVLNLDIYKDKVCSGKFQCLSANDFNKKYLADSYDDQFLYNLFRQTTVNYKDKKNNILIKIR